MGEEPSLEPLAQHCHTAHQQPPRTPAWDSCLPASNLAQRCVPEWPVLGLQHGVGGLPVPSQMLYRWMTMMMIVK